MKILHYWRTYILYQALFNRIWRQRHAYTFSTSAKNPLKLKYRLSRFLSRSNSSSYVLKKPLLFLAAKSLLKFLCFILIKILFSFEPIIKRFIIFAELVWSEQLRYTFGNKYFWLGGPCLALAGHIETFHASC